MAGGGRKCSASREHLTRGAPTSPRQATKIKQTEEKTNGGWGRSWGTRGGKHGKNNFRKKGNDRWRNDEKCARTRKEEKNPRPLYLSHCSQICPMGGCGNVCAVKVYKLGSATGRVGLGNLLLGMKPHGICPLVLRCKRSRNGFLHQLRERPSLGTSHLLHLAEKFCTYTQHPAQEDMRTGMMLCMRENDSALQNFVHEKHTGCVIECQQSWR